MKAVLEPNEILIRQIPNDEIIDAVGHKRCPGDSYYITEVSPDLAGVAWSTVKYSLEEVFRWIRETFEPESAPKK